jgi:Zn-dependent protease with chaperone function
VARARTVFGLQAALALAAAALLAFAFAASVSGMHFDLPTATALAEACRNFALPDVTATSVAGLAIGSLAVAVLILGARSAARQLLASRRFLRRLRAVGRGPHGAVLFESPDPQAVCAGLLRPRVYLSTGTLEALTEEELDAVLAHEAHHARVRDPLQVFIVRVVADALFFLPAAQGLAERYSSLAELAADSAAVHKRGSQSLASALLAFEAANPAVVGIAPERVDHLLGERPTWALPLGVIAWSLVALTALAVVGLRLDAAHTVPTLSLPLLVAETCMLLMAILPLVLGAVSILAARRAASARQAV